MDIFLKICVILAVAVGTLYFLRACVVQLAYYSYRRRIAKAFREYYTEDEDNV